LSCQRVVFSLSTYKFINLKVSFTETQAKGDTDNRDGKQKKKEKKIEGNQEIRNRKKKKERQSKTKDIKDGWGWGREMENISTEVLPSGIFSLSSQMGPCRTLRLQDYRVQDYSSPFPPLLNVMYCVRVSLEDSQNIPCATLKRRGP
jgi:hypothetical protein